MQDITVQEEISIEVRDVRITEVRKDCFKVTIATSRGDNRGLLHHRIGNTAGAVLVSGAGGGLDGPASVYRDIGPDLLERGVSSLRLDYRMLSHFEECVLDALTGIDVLKGLGIERIGIAGWSFGGAVAIETGVLSRDIAAVATVASQSYGTERVDELAPRALLLIHGTADRTLPIACSEDIFRRAGEPKRIILYDGANHGLDQNRDEMLREIESFFARELAPDWTAETSGGSSS